MTVLLTALQSWMADHPDTAAIVVIIATLAFMFFALCLNAWATLRSPNRRFR